MAAATYDPAIPTDKDFVRLMSGDRDISRPALYDGEIEMLLSEEVNKYLAAARACELILSRSKGLVTKQVGDLKLQYADSEKSAYFRHSQKLREQGARRSSTGPQVLRVLGG